MLVQDGRITDEQLADAIEQQRQAGGKLGTVLVELGLISLDTLTVFLGVELSTPIATKAALEKAKQRAVRLLAPDAALTYLCVPLLIQERQVIAAIADPHDMEALDDLLRITGYRIVPRVAPEVRIHAYIERYYGVSQPPRFAALAEAEAEDDAPLSRPLPGLPKRSAQPVQAPNKAPPLRTPTAPPTNAAAGEDHADDDDSLDEIELEAADLLFELDNDDEEEAAPVGGSFAQEQAPTIITPREQQDAYEPVSVADTLAAIEEASGRNEIAKSLMAYASGVFDVAALCIVRDNMAFGWKAHGDNLDRARIETLLAPLDRPSIFQNAITAPQHSFTGAASRGTVDKYLYKVLCSRAPSLCVVRAIVIGNRIVNVFYGHNANGEIAENELAGIADVCRAARRAYVRMITRA